MTEKTIAYLITILAILFWPVVGFISWLCDRRKKKKGTYIPPLRSDQ